MNYLKKLGPAINGSFPSGSLNLVVSEHNLNVLQTYKDALKNGDLIQAKATSVLYFNIVLIFK